MALLRRSLVPIAGLASLFALAAACGGGSATQQSSAATGSGGSSATGTGGHAAASSSSTGTGGSGGTGGGGASTTLALPQLVHGAAYADTDLFQQIPVVVAVSGATPESVDVTVDNGTPAAATKDTNGYVATVDVQPLDPGSHMLVAEAKAGGKVTATATGTLVIDAGSVEFTHVATDGIAFGGHLVHDTAADVLDYTWVDVPGNTEHQLYFNQLDGAFQRLLPSDVALNDPADEPLSGYTAFGPMGIGVVYMVQKPNDAHWLVKMRVVDPGGQKVLVPTMDLTQGQAAFSQQTAGVDPSGFSAAWLHITPAPDPSNPPPVEIRFARWDMSKSKLVGPLTLDSDQPQPPNSTQGPQILEPLAEMSIACNADVCLVAYVRDVYDALVQLNEPKVFLAVVDLATGTLAKKPAPVEATDWDPQLFGNHLLALPDGSFVLVYEGVDTAAAINPVGCDDTEERDLVFAVKIDETGKLLAEPKPIFNHQGTREYPRIAQVPEGFALFWEDQRSECNPSGGHIGMAANTVAPDLSKLLDTYVELPGSIVLPPMYPTLAATGTSFVTAWSDNRHGAGLTDDEDEIYLDTYWHE